MNKIELTGNISKIYDSDEKFIWFNICRNEKYKDKNGEMQQAASFFDVKIERSKTDNELFKLGSFITVIGTANSYLDKNNNKRFYIFAYEINNPLDKKESDPDSTISYDKDGVMLWHGKRCENTPATEEEKREMEALLSEFQ